MDNCLICQKPVPDYDPKMCCSGHECGCMGMPTEPCCCSAECEKAVYDHIGVTMEERRILAKIPKWIDGTDEPAIWNVDVKVEIGESND